MQEAANAFRTALDIGVVIGCGSDVGVFAHGENLAELEAMAELGMRIEDALTAATATSATIIRREKELGRLREGFLADIVAVDGDPLSDLAALRTPRLVIKNGERVD
jgi:imidazolonepropionase-like amidohydrolase